MFATDSGQARDKDSVRERVPAPVVNRANEETTLEIYAQVQKRVSRKNVHAAFDELVNGANRDTVRSPL